MIWKGVWDSDPTYAADDAVQHDGTAWIALRASTNVTPEAGDDWSLLALGVTASCNVGELVTWNGAAWACTARPYAITSVVGTAGQIDAVIKRRECRACAAVHRQRQHLRNRGECPLARRHACFGVCGRDAQSRRLRRQDRRQDDRAADGAGARHSRVGAVCVWPRAHGLGQHALRSGFPDRGRRRRARRVPRKCSG